MSSSRSESTLFLPVDPLIKNASGALWLRNLDDVARFTRRKRVWTLGSSARLKSAMQEVLETVRGAAESFRLTNFSLDEARLGETARFLSRIGAARIADNILLLLEEEYGPAYDRLCHILTGHVPALLPTGLCMPAGPGLSWSPEHVGVALAGSEADLSLFLEKKRLLICNAAGQYASAIEPGLRCLERQFFISGMIDADPSRQGTRLAGMEVFPPERLARDDYDCLVSTRFFFDRSRTLLNALPPDNTPLVLLGSPHTITAAAEVVLCHSLFSDADGLLQAAKPEDQAGLFRRHYHRLYPPGRGETHCRDLADAGLQWLFKGRSIVPADSAGPLINTSDGMRRTTDQPDRYDNSIHTFGKSYVFGNYNEDGSTIASCLQRLCNEQYQAKALPVRYIVRNKGLSGSDAWNMLRLLHDAPLLPGDLAAFGMTPEMYTPENLAIARRMWESATARGASFAVFLHPVPWFLDNPSEHELEVMHFRAQQYGDPFLMEKTPERFPAGNAAFRDALVAQGVPAYDLMPFFQRPHGMGEIFADCFHTVGRANERIAAVMYDAFVRNALPVDSSGMDALALRELISVVRRSARSNLSIDHWLDAVPRFPGAVPASLGAIVMNCNPFTIGHKQIISAVLERTQRLYIFVVQEDQSRFPFARRLEMVKAGVGEYGDRVLVAPSGAFILSAHTFPEYFSKDSLSYAPDATLDILLFGTVIAPALGIGARYLGEEPLCAVTRAYLEQLRQLLPLCGLECVVLPRLEDEKGAVSASRVRAHLAEGEWEAVEKLVPQTTLDILRAMEEEKNPR